MFKYKIIQLLFWLLIVLSICLAIFYNGLWFLPLLITLLYIVLITTGVFGISLGFFGENISCITTNKKEILLTFDDGPHPTITLEVLEVLARHQVKAVFFCIGSQIDAYPEIAKRIIDEGHVIGNHTYNHKLDFTYRTQHYLIQELQKTEKAIKELGIKSYKIFRPPYGVTNPNIVQAAQKEELKIIGWTNRSFDTVISEPSDVVKVVMKKLRMGDIILFHDRLKHTPQVLDTFLQEASLRGFLFDGLDRFKQQIGCI